MVKDKVDSVCFIGRINEILPIPGADKIVQGKIGEWSTVIGKDQFKVNDLVVICTQDAVIPEQVSEPLNIKSYLRKGIRVKTVKLKGVYSECLILDLKEFSEIKNSSLYEGMDLQDILKIYKYEEPEVDTIPKVKRTYFKLSRIHSYKMWRGFFNYKYYKFKSWLTRIKNNPNFKIYHKFPNFKNVSNYFEDEELVTVQRKIHGSNIRFFLNRKGEFYIGSHRVVKGARFLKKNKLKEILIKMFLKKGTGYYDSDIFTEMANKYYIEDRLRNYLNTLISTENVQSIEIYGEVYGQGVQGEFDYGLDHRECVFFDVQLDGIYQDPGKSLMIINNGLNLPIVETVDFTFCPFSFIKENYSQYFKETWGNGKPHEGIVVKAVKQGEPGLRAVKIINPDYLTYADKHDLTDFH